MNMRMEALTLATVVDGLPTSNKLKLAHCDS
jgi:hypothetical protein